MLNLFSKNLITKTPRILLTNSLFRAKSSQIAQTVTENLQEASMNEVLFRIDESDKVIGHGTKRELHRVTKDGDLPLHRGLSVYLFNSHGDLLLQKRSAEKITFPGTYTNSCCSHPVVGLPGEDDVRDGVGIKRAAVRRLNYELGIPVDKLPLENFTYVTRAYYKVKADGGWGEHEIFYVLFLRGDLPLSPNPSEVSEIVFVPREKLDECIKTLGPLTPWFQLVLKHRLKLWWDNLDNLDRVKDHENIFRLTSN